MTRPIRPHRSFRSVPTNKRRAEQLFPLGTVVRPVNQPLRRLEVTGHTYRGDLRVLDEAAGPTMIPASDAVTVTA